MTKKSSKTKIAPLTKEVVITLHMKLEGSWNSKEIGEIAEDVKDQLYDRGDIVDIVYGVLTLPGK
jgi:hypothetical protein